MELKILGPFEVCDDSGQPVKLPAGRERTLLAVLALRQGEVVSSDELIDVLWGEQSPPTAGKALQGYVSHLRGLLRSVGEDGALVTRSPGYALLLGNDVVDGRRFEALAAEGWRQLDDDSRTALATFEEALALWRGPVLGEFAFADFAQREIHRLGELRLETVEGRFEALLRLGKHGAAVAQLEACVDEHPLRERLRGQLMLALYRSGRQADALAVYRDGRRILHEDLGLEPGTELQRLEHAILEQDPELDAPVAVRSPGPARPHNGTPPSSPRRHGRRAAAGIVLLLAGVFGLTIGYLAVRDDAVASVTVVPPALVVVDPATESVVASIPMGSRPVAVAAGEGAVWVGDARDTTVTRVDPATRTSVKTIGIGEPVVDLATGVGAVWAATGGFGSVVRIDPEVDAVAQKFRLGDPADPVVPSVSAVAAGDGRVWAAASNGIVRIDPLSGEVLATIDLGPTSALQLATGGGALWATTLGSRVKRFEAGSAGETAEFYAGAFVYPVALGGEAVWVGGDGQLWKLDPATATSLLSVRPIAGYTSVAYGEGAVWVTSYQEGAVARVDPRTGGVLATIPVGGRASDVVFHDGLVWVTVERAS